MENYPLKPPLQNSASPRLQEPDDSDLEKLRKWQEERLTRKLRGEYESAVLHLSELVSCLHPRRELNF
jgi:outer membrane protein insertion porin family